jgi:hypothetical protein
MLPTSRLRSAPPTDEAGGATCSEISPSFRRPYPIAVRQPALTLRAFACKQ